MAAPGAAGSQLGLAKETTFGTAVPVTRFVLPESEALKAETQPIQYRSFNTIVQLSAMRRQVVRGAGGPFSVPVTQKGMGLLLQQIFGDSVSAQVGATVEYTQTHVLDEAAGGRGVHATVQVGRSQSSGTVTPFTYDGCVAKEATFTCDENGFLMVEVTWVCRYVTTTGAGAFALQTASYAVANPPFAWDQAAIVLNSVARVTKKWSLKLSRALDDARYGLGSTTRREPLLAGEWAVTGELDMEFENTTDYAAFIAGSVWPLTVVFTSADLILAGAPFKITFTLPAIAFSGDTPTIGGEGLIRQPLPYMVLDNGTAAPVTVEQRTSDTAL